MVIFLTCVSFSSSSGSFRSFWTRFGPTNTLHLQNRTKTWHQNRWRSEPNRVSSCNRTGVGLPLGLQVLQVVAVRPGLQQRQVTREEARSPGGLLRRQAAQEAQAERQRPSREGEASEAAGRPRRLRSGNGTRRGEARTGRPGGLMPRLKVRLQAQQVGDGEAFGSEPGAVQPGLIEAEPRREHPNPGFVFAELLPARHPEEEELMKVWKRVRDPKGGFIRTRVQSGGRTRSSEGGGEGSPLNPRGLIATNFPPIRSGFSGQRRRRRRRKV